MKHLKNFLDLLTAIIKAWPIFVFALLILSSLIIRLTEASKVTFQFTISLPLLIVVIAFALYPVLKVIHWLASRPMKPFIYTGLLWRPSKLSFRYPTPLCPREGCGCEIVCKATPSVNMKPISGPILQAYNSYRYIYECPIHGIIDRVPEEDIAELQIKARMVQNRSRALNTECNE